MLMRIILLLLCLILACSNPVTENNAISINKIDNELSVVVGSITYADCADTIGTCSYVIDEYPTPYDTTTNVFIFDECKDNQWDGTSFFIRNHQLYIYFVMRGDSTCKVHYKAMYLKNPLLDK